MCDASCNKKLVVLYGPTAVGKTEASLLIAESMPVEIINMDVGQLYEPLSIGVAKPDWRNAHVAHHLFDVITQPRDFTVIEYRSHVLNLCQVLWKKGKTPLLVGGSGFYLKSLLFPPVQHVAPLERPLNLAPTWDNLYAVDPERALSLEKNDTYRIERAMHVWNTTGIKPSHLVPSFDPPACCITLIHLTRDRKELYTRINERVHLMMQEGWIDEVRALLHTDWIPFIQRKKLIGYAEILDFIERGDTDVASLIVTIQKKTRHYAKRQETFWRMLMRVLQNEIDKKAHPFHLSMHTINLTLDTVGLYIKQLFE